MRTRRSEMRLINLVAVDFFFTSSIIARREAKRDCQDKACIGI